MPCVASILEADCHNQFANWFRNDMVIGMHDLFKNICILTVDGFFDPLSTGFLRKSGALLHILVQLSVPCDYK